MYMYSGSATGSAGAGLAVGGSPKVVTVEEFTQGNVTVSFDID